MHSIHKTCGLQGVYFRSRQHVSPTLAPFKSCRPALRKKRRVADNEDLSGGMHAGGSAGLPAEAAVSAAPAKKSKKSGGFQSMGLSPEVLRAVQRLGFKVPTPIQRKALPIALSGRDVVAMARTGSGKTAAFLVPLVERLRAHSTRIGSRAVVLSPTRELALQTAKVATALARYTDLRIATLVGGESMNEQFATLAGNPDVLIATPGRLAHLLREVPSFSLRAVQFAVFDEADRLFEMGFAVQLGELLAGMPETRQTLLFSATLPGALVQFAKAGLREPELVRLDADTKVSGALRMSFFTVRAEEKPGVLLYILRDLLPPTQQALVFVATRHHVEFLTSMLQRSGLSAEAVYGSMDQTARKINLARFRARTVRFLVVTDVAARGLDIPLLDNVVNYDAPDKPKLFVHRVGRVARQGRAGTAFTLLAASDLPYFLDLMLFLGRPVTNTTASGGGYTLEAMTPDDVHYGSVPRSVVEPEIETVRALIAAHTDLAAALRSVTNSLKLYNKTRAEASRTSVQRARALIDDRVHPLLLGAGSSGEGELRAFVAGLAAFRPTQSVLEIDAAAARGGEATVAALARARRHNAAAVGPRVGAVSMRVAAAAATRGTSDTSGYGGAVLRGLHRKENDGVVGSKRARGGDEEEEVEDEDATHGNSDDDSDEDGDAEGRRGTALPLAAVAPAVAPVVVSKPRVSRAARRRAASHAPQTQHAVPSAGELQRAEVPKSKADAVVASARKADSFSDDDDEDDDDANHDAVVIGTLDDDNEDGRSGLPTGGLTALPKAIRRERLRAAVSRSGGGPAGVSEATAALFRNTSQYVAHAPLAQLVTDAGYSGAGTLAGALGGGGTRGGGGGETVAADMEGLTRLEEHAFDLAGDERGALGKSTARRVRYWDATKKRYLLIDASEIRGGVRRKPAADGGERNEAGARVGGAAATSGKHAYGELYRKWVKSTRREVETGGAVEMDGGDDEGGGADDGAAPARAIRGRGAGAAARGRGGSNASRAGGGGRAPREDGIVDFGSGHANGDEVEAGGARKDYRADSGGRRGSRGGSRGASASGGVRSGKHVTQELRNPGQIAKERLRKARSSGKLPTFLGTRSGGAGRGRGGAGRGGGGGRGAGGGRGGGGRGRGGRGGRR